MSSIWRHPKSRFWTACFRDEQGRQRRVSTKTESRRDARRIADEYEKAIRNKRTLHQLEKVLRAFHEELSGEAVQKYSLRDFTSEWLAEKQASVAYSTIKFYKGVVGKLLRYFGPRADEPINAIARADLIGFRTKLAEQISASAANHDWIGVRALFRAARSAGRIAEDPTEGVKPLRSELNDTPRRAFTIGELQLLLAKCDPEWASMIKIGLYTGARLCDVATLKWGDIDFERGELRFTARKTRKSVLVPIVGGLRSHLMERASSDDTTGCVHPRAAASVAGRGSSATLSAQFGELLRLAGLRSAKPPKTIGTRRHQFDPLSFHSLRHSFVSFLKDAGTAQATVMEMAGHSSVEMSAIYTHTDRQSMERALTSLPQL